MPIHIDNNIYKTKYKKFEGAFVGEGNTRSSISDQLIINRRNEILKKLTLDEYYKERILNKKAMYLDLIQ
jgi:hypothetical protein